MSVFRKVKIKTVFQEYYLKVFNEFTLEDGLRMHRLPANLFQGYVAVKGQVENPIPLSTVVGAIDEHKEIILQCLRNTDLRQVLPQKTFYQRAEQPITTIHRLNLGEKECTETIHEINEHEARKIVASKVEEFMTDYNHAKLIIAGISGGGDSNILVRSLVNYINKNDRAKELICFTLIFEPLWPVSAAQRAAVLCGEHNIEHLIYRQKDIEEFLGMKGSLSDFFEEFSRSFGTNTSHFFGTYFISLIARKLSTKYQTNEYCLGFNREDVLAELLFSLMNGYKPLSFPVRQFGPIRLLMPLWEIPKIVLDACYPKYSLENYHERNDTTTFQRGIIYYLAHAVEDVYYNLGLSFMQGVSKLLAGDWAKLHHDKEWDLYISEYADHDKVSQVEDLLKKYFTSSINT